jgi:hypothetical protein
MSKLLYKEDYTNLVLELIKHGSPESCLNFYEKEYLSINVDLWESLRNEIDRHLPMSYDKLPENYDSELKDHSIYLNNRPDVIKLKRIKRLVIIRGQEILIEKDNEKLKTLSKKDQVNKLKSLPSAEDLFSEGFLLRVLNKYTDYWEKKNDKYYWSKSNVELSAFVEKSKDKFKPDFQYLKSKNQDLARIFYMFFNKDYPPKIAKEFKPSEISLNNHLGDFNKIINMV